MIINNNGEILSIELDNLFPSVESDLKFKNIKTNLDIEGGENSKIMGTLIYDKKILFHILPMKITVKNIIFHMQKLIWKI